MMYAMFKMYAHYATRYAGYVSCTGVALVLISLIACNKPTPTSQPSTPRIVDFQPGIRIDYRIPQVEIDGEIILREGALELFAYAKSPTPKEHESIVLLRSSPEHIYQALGLIGLTPGKPPRYFHETKTQRPASGDGVDVLVRHEKDREVVETFATDWMYDVKRKGPMQRTHWLFTGSERTDDGSFAASVEGTVVPVVDFPSSLLCLPTPHTDANAELWLKANTDAIPPIKSKVTLVLRPAKAAH